MAQFGMEPTEANYRRASDVLVALSNNGMDEGCAAWTERGSSTNMIRSYYPAMTGEWHEYAAPASAFVTAE